MWRVNFRLVFPTGGDVPVALMGVSEGSNAYVSPDGQWLARYVPAHIRHYPLALVRVPVARVDAAAPAPDSSRLAVLVDVASACVSFTEGEPVFGGDGQPAGAAQRKIRLMKALRARAVLTQRLVKAIDEAGLLVERNIQIQTPGELVRAVSGLKMVDESALNKLDDVAFNKLRAMGALPLVYASLLSWANFRQGPMGKSHPLPAPAGLPGDDVIRFN